MEMLKKNRTIVRITFKKVFNHLESVLSSEIEDDTKLQAQFKLLESKNEELQLLNKQIYDVMLEEDCSEETIVNDINKSDEYSTCFNEIQIKVNKVIRNLSNDLNTNETNRNSNNQVSQSNLRKFKLPFIELKKFDGNLINWLQFWAQFSKIHNDCDIASEDKFQYLLQAIESNTRAYDLICSFPATGSNYEKVIESLKSRFGKEDLLVEVYIRELLKLVLQNVLDKQVRSKMSLQTLYDKLESHLRAIDSLGVTTEKCAAMLFPLVESCLPEDLLRAWHRSSLHTGDEAKSRLDNLMKFLLSEVEGEQRIGLAMSSFDLENLSISSTFKASKKVGQNSVYHKKVEVPSAASLVYTGKPEVRVSYCIFCSKSHKSQDCFVAQKMSLEERRRIVKEKNVCYCCLTPGHRFKDCKANIKCVLCKKKHFLLMCTRFQIIPSMNMNDKARLKVSETEPTKSSDENPLMLKQSNVLANKTNKVRSTSNIFMQTLLVNVENPENGLVTQARVLFDTGSQQSYVVTDLAKVMGYKSLGKETIVHTLFGNVKSREQVHNRYKIHMASISNKSIFACEMEVLDQPVICGNVSHVSPGPWITELLSKQIVLTDVEDNSLPISILIGADIMGKLLTGKIIQLSCGLIAIETRLGWTLMGKAFEEKSKENGLTKSLITMFVKEADISELWSLDSLGIKDPYEHLSKEAKNLAVKMDFLGSTKINEEKRYEVVLPWIEGHAQLPSNQGLAKKRLSVLLKKMDKENMYQEYDEVLNQWQKEDIIEKVPQDEENNFGHYLPHRPVIKEGNTSTRIRPVFDASAHETNKMSLNDCLECGPNMIELIPSVMLRFREGKFGVIADIRKAFLQISIDPSDRDFLRFLWYKKDENKFVIYRHKRVVFGLKCSPFLLGAVIELHLQKMIENEKEVFKDVADKLKKSFYVDNVSTSLDTKENMQHFVEKASTIMAKGNFDLRKWEWTHISTEETCSTNVNVLGINWNVKEDVLYINTDFVQDMNFLPLTKRKILSIAHRVFDPIGYTCPVTLCPKLLLQKMWQKQIGWDTEVDEEISEEFFKWLKYLPFLKEVKIPRWIGKITTLTNGCSLHTFCDGSKVAYATVIFLRVVNGSNVSVTLVSAKSRVVPLKDISIPRIELLAAMVGARLTETVKKAMDWYDMTTYFWTDSMTVLAWIKQENKWKVFVQNRVTEIKTLTKVNQWNYVPGELNMADLPSRGCNAKQLIDSKWTEGPQWLKTDESLWPIFQQDCGLDLDEVNTETTKSTIINDCLTQKENKVKTKLTEWCTNFFSQYLKMVRLVSWVSRFINNCKLEKSLRVTGELTAIEIESAEIYLFKQIQQESLNGINDRKISTLSPILDETGLIRLETKLCNKDDTYGFRYPIVLSPEHKIVKCLIVHYHEKNCHAGVQLLLNILREKYWILGGRKVIRSIISKCVKCKRYKAKRLEAKTGMLPANRLRESTVFEVVGTDFAGPIYLKKNQKAWICLYTCAVYRAIHLELVTSLSTDAFLQAFRRFIARRGRPHIVYSDNGLNYVGTNNALKELNWEEIRNYSSTNHIEWKFNPPTAPWWGGWWERLVRLTKELLRRVLGKACLNYEEMTTILCDCEGVINSRPLTYISESEAEVIPLTPNHFLHDLRDFGVPDIDKIDEISLNKRQRYLQSLRKDLRKRFRSEYLGQLVQNIKPNVKYNNIKVGDVVIIGIDNKKRIDWPLALVVELLPDRKGTTRLVKVKTRNQILLRPIQRLYPLEISAEDIEKVNETQKLIATEKPPERKSLQDSRKQNRSTEFNENLKLNQRVKLKTTKFGRSIKIPLKYTLFFE